MSTTANEQGTVQAPPIVAQQERLPNPIPGIRPPAELIVEGNIGDNWKLFKQKWINYSIITNLEAHPRRYAVALFLHTIGDNALKIYNGFTFPNEENITVADIIAKFDTFAVGETNETYERFLFNKRNQLDCESFETFLAAIRSLVKTCNYCENCIDSILRDRIVLGIRDTTTQTALLKERNLTLQTCIDTCKAAENAVAQGKDLRPDVVNKVSSRRHKSSRQSRQSKPAPKPLHCKFCGNTHVMKREECPAWGKQCSKCGQSNHFPVKCPNSKYRPRVHKVQHDDSNTDSETSDEEWIKVVHSKDHKSSKEVKCRLLVGPSRTEVAFQIDTGASVNILPESYADNIVDTNKKLTMWNNTDVSPLGTCRTTVRNPANNKKYSVEFVVVRNDLSPLISYQAAEQMKLLSINENNVECVASVKAMDKYADVFSKDLGKFSGRHHLKVDPSVIPVVMPDRRTPLSVRPALKAELDRLCKLKVIEPVDMPTPWVSQLVLTKKKNGQIRICIDPQELNKALLREHYTLPVLEDTLHEMRDSRFFSKADLSSGYWHVELDEESSLLTTFQTCFGRYKWLRLPFGTCASAEIFQKKILEALSNLPGVVCIADDVIIHGKSLEEHDAHLDSFLRRCQEKGLKLNADKMEIQLKEITFMGHRITENGLHSDPEKVRAIMDMPPPTNLEELRRYLGVVNYLGKFLPNATNTLSPLQNLLKKDVSWTWSSAQQEAFETIKKLVTSSPVLSFYDPHKELTLENDASEYGLGAAIYQEGNPIAFASRSLTSAERNYAQIEKEMLAVCFGLEKFHHYTYGRRVTVITDHKPLESIVLKPLSKAPKRLQSLLLRTQKYDYSVMFKSGKSIPVADALSRSPLSDPNEPEFVNDNIAFIAIKDDRLQEIKSATERDETLMKLKTVIMTGWPPHRASLPSALTPYHDYRDELTVQDGIILRGHRVIIPTSMRREIKEKVHAGHLGINSCIRRAKDMVYWPGVSKEIRQFVESCDTCASMPDKQSLEPLIMHEIPSRAWEKVATDIFTIDARNYLITVDYFSNFFEIDYLLDTTSETVIAKLKHHFARHGIPDKVVSDGGPQYTSQSFRNFSRKWCFEHVMSSPGNSQSNGCAEAHVKIAKRIMRKCLLSKQDPYLGLLNWRNTPTEGLGSSPVQRAFGHRTKTLLPTTDLVLMPDSNTQHSAPKQKLLKEQKQSKTAEYYMHRKDLKPLNLGDSVTMQPIASGDKIWKPATVTKVLDNRTYEVSRKGKTYRRNRRLLRTTSAVTNADDEVSTSSPVKTNVTVECSHPTVTSPPPASDVNEPSTSPVAPSQPPASQNQPDIAEHQSKNIVSKSPGLSSDTPYVTRSGRVVKEVVRYNCEQFV